MDDLLTLPECTDAACCRLNIRLLKEQVDHLASEWKVTFAKRLQTQAIDEMQELLEYVEWCGGGGEEVDHRQPRPAVRHRPPLS